MQLDLNCRDCQAGLAQIGQVGLAFMCYEHGKIGIAVVDLMEVAAKNATIPLEAKLKEQEETIKQLIANSQEYGREIERARVAEREACIEVVKNLRPKYSKFGQPTKDEYIEALSERKYLFNP